MSKKPNILLIMTDQQRYDSLGCYGCEVVPTPNLDRLAGEGVLFKNCYVNNPICTPSRASLQTGKPLPGHGVYKVYDILPEKEIFFPKRLKMKDYTTALFGKLHVSGRSYEREHRHPNDGFDIYEYAMTPHDVRGTYNSYGKWLKKNHPDFYERLRIEGRKIGNIPKEVHFTRWAAERTIDFIKNYKKNNPFFCFMSVVDPHDPYSDYPIEMADLVNEDKIPLPVKNEDYNLKPEGIQREHDHSYLGGFHNYSKEQIYKMRKGYFASIAFLDQEVGRVITELEKKNILDDTLIIFTSDHGDALGDHELLAKGAFFYDAVTKVPLIMRYPAEIKSGQSINELVQLHDITATILNQAGFTNDEIKKYMPNSNDLISLLQDSDTNNYKWREYATCLYRNTGINDEKLYWNPQINATMYRTKEFKLNIYHDNCSELSQIGELFDMNKDPYEENNLWNNPEYQAIRSKLILQLMNWMVEIDVQYTGSIGGEAFPDKSQCSLNNPL